MPIGLCPPGIIEDCLERVQRGQSAAERERERERERQRETERERERETERDRAREREREREIVRQRVCDRKDGRGEAVNWLSKSQFT